MARILRQTTSDSDKIIGKANVKLLKNKQNSIVFYALAKQTAILAHYIPETKEKQLTILLTSKDQSL